VCELTKKGVAVDFHLSGAMTNRKIADSATPASPFTLKVSDMFSLMPYENSLVVLSLNGPQLKQILERAYRNYYYYKYVPGYGGYSYYTTCMLDINAGGQITYNDLYPALPDGDNVASLTFGGKEVDFADASTYYRVSTVNYLAAGSCNFNDGGVSLWPLNQIVHDTQYYVRDAVIDFVTFKGTVSPAVEGRINFIYDVDPPVITVFTPQPTVEYQDGVTFQAQAVDSPCGVDEVLFYVREPDGVHGTPIGFEDLQATPRAGDIWEYPFDTTLTPDGEYVFLVKARDKCDNEGWAVVPFGIRNLAVIELLPSTPRNKAGRTMPVKFSLRVVPSADPAQPFVFNTQLAIKIYQCTNASCSSKVLKQTSVYGTGSKNYRIDIADELYITNFKTESTPATYVVEIWRTTKNWMVGSFTFSTVK
jgi:hypothetical protein